ncbi:pyrroline-5-carboxylate reductase [Bacteroides pyogenes]|uniref:pyrroline-5-carboxylate reductase n=1 Tax=Bacteroides pyogenes TaxID=310300 RepID=UPI0003DD8005|nr:pyrroline-5-carboxylate reductase [Bacteroides pyogenes]MBB3894970.1 pyrroline-5-carboxylate reductase [Bacteroides pyogenes]GAE22603.1 pyrroline-5-carboxylate reductase [Bacteroides pyogenes JCM 10003]SUV33297.1 pyrroline-5-carboxylate reductase [Bacteroides pyogenes]
MKTAIIGAGNMGGSIARGLANGSLIAESDIIVSDPDAAKLERLKKSFPAITTTHNNVEAASGADMVIVAVKPPLMKSVVRELKLKSKQILISVAAGISFEELAHFVMLPEIPMYRVIPNTAICERESMTLISARNTSSEQDEFILRLFNEMGMPMIIPEEKMGAATALASCGIAYVLKYIQASMQAGIEMGLSAENAMTMIAQSAKGAAALILNNDTHPGKEIDKVTTPGGMTIKGINELEHNGFSSAVIKAMKATLS